MAEKFLPGQYCQVQFSLNGGDLLGQRPHRDDRDAGRRSAGNDAPRHLVTSRPNVVQILERRKFVRTQLATRTPVMVRWPEDDRLAEASLFNIGGGGLAFRIGKDFGDRIHIGDRMEATFELPGLPRRFTFQLSMCNKTVGQRQRQRDRRRAVRGRSRGRSGRPPGRTPPIPGNPTADQPFRGNNHGTARYLYMPPYAMRRSWKPWRSRLRPWSPCHWPTAGSP